MATCRLIRVRIWEDPHFDNASKDGKLIFLYLISNPLATESGIYPVSIKTISNRTGVQLTTVSKQLGNSLRNVTYDADNQCVFVHHFLKYNGGGKPDLLRKAIVRECKETQTPLWHKFVEFYPNYKDALLPLLTTVNQLLPNSSIVVAVDNSIRNRSTLAHKFDEFWNLYPKRKGKRLGKKAAKEWFDENVEIKQVPDLLVATKNYANSSYADSGHVKDAIRWLRTWPEWIEPEANNSTNGQKCRFPGVNVSSLSDSDLERCGCHKCGESLDFRKRGQLEEAVP